MVVISLLQKDLLASNLALKNITLIFMIIRTFGWLFYLCPPCLGVYLHAWHSTLAEENIHFSHLPSKSDNIK